MLQYYYLGNHSKQSFLLIIKFFYQRLSLKNVCLEILQNSQENTCARISFLIKLTESIKKETLAEVFSCEFCEILKTPFLQNAF